MLGGRILFFLVLSSLAGNSWAIEQSWRGMLLTDYVEYLANQGRRVIYSTSLVTNDLVVANEPPPEASLESLRETLEPFGLTVAEGPDGVWLIVRDVAARTDKPSNTAMTPGPTPLPEIIVSSSVYNIHYATSGSHTFLDREFSAGLPDVGEEAMSVIARVPGVANGGVSARSHVRGGANDEQLILFDGLRLYEPYHLKDFHSIFSIVDQRTTDGIDFYTAGYQARYGDRMSGVVDMQLRERPAERQTELGLSLLTTSAMSMGRFASNDRGDWLVSARRGNLDLLTKAFREEYGQPRYEDLFAHVGWEWSDRTSVAANYLYSRDRLELAQLDGSENAVGRYRNNVGWLKINTDWEESISSSTILSTTDISNSRQGRTDVPNVVSGVVSDSRSFNVFGFKQDWLFDTSDRWSFRTGVDIKRLEATYAYDSSLQIFSPFDQIFDNMPSRETSIRAAPDGEQYAIYGEARWKATNKMIIDFGFRWDWQTYSVADTDEQWSPRLNVLYQLGPRTELRAGIGRYYQAQEINELQYRDGVVEFFPPQHADHVVASITHQFSDNLDVRVEAYQKSYDSLIPRFENVFDPLVLLPELQIDRVRVDADDAFVRGAEITLSGGNAKSTTRWWASYVWASTEDSVAGEDVRRPWDQKHAIRGGVSTRWGRWDISAAATWHSGWPETELYTDTVQNGDGSTDLIATTSPINSLDYGSFHTLDVRASRIFPLRKGELTAFVEISNVYNRENPCCVSYRLKTDQFGNSLLRTKQDFWLPLLPSFGVVWKF